MTSKTTLLFFVFLLLSITSPTTLQPRAPQSNCGTCAPNPIASTYPSNITGTINATTLVIIVPLTYARSLLPSRLVPLPHAYARFSIPSTHYPLVLETTIEHDIRYEGANAVADFSSLRLTFPFIDLLNDNSTCFKYTSYIYLPPTVPLATAGAETYGITVLLATFDPADASYARSSPGREDYVFSVYPNTFQTPGLQPAASVCFQQTSAAHALPLAFYRNVTNQPTFGNNTAVCDNLIRFWNTSVTAGLNEPENVLGVVRLSPPLVGEETVWSGVKGVRATEAFLENNDVPCAMLRGYGGTGEGDSG